MYDLFISLALMYLACLALPHLSEQIHLSEHLFSRSWPELFGCTVAIVISYHMSRNIDSDFNLAIRRSHKDDQINLHHY